MDISGTFEAKGIADAKSRLTFVAAEVREPFPPAVKDAAVRCNPLAMCSVNTMLVDALLFYDVCILMACAQ